MASNRPEAYERLCQFVVGSRIGLALHTAVETGLPDLLAAGPKTTETLSSKTGLPVDSIRRLVRALARFGVFNESAEDTFENTELSNYLRSDTKPSLGGLVRFIHHDAVMAAWSRVSDVLKTGEPAFEAVHGESLFAYVSHDEKLRGIFYDMMVNMHGPEAVRIAAGYSFGQFPRLLDVGGGNGHILAEILSQHNGVEGAVLELAPMVSVAREFLSQWRLESRWDVVDGNFFESVPAGFDAYMIKSVLHDWNDDKATQILRNCREALKGDGRVLIVEGGHGHDRRQGAHRKGVCGLVRGGRAHSRARLANQGQLLLGGRGQARLNITV